MKKPIIITCIVLGAILFGTWYACFVVMGDGPYWPWNKKTIEENAPSDEIPINRGLTRKSSTYGYSFEIVWLAGKPPVISGVVQIRKMPQNPKIIMSWGDTKVSFQDLGIPYNGCWFFMYNIETKQGENSKLDWGFLDDLKVVRDGKVWDIEAFKKAF